MTCAPSGATRSLRGSDLIGGSLGIDPVNAYAKANAKYKGKTLRVTGVVGDIYDDMLYLPVKGKNETVRVGIRYGQGNKPSVKKGDKATFEGEFELVAVLGPLLVKCRLVEDDAKKKK
jgi:putative nucleic acid binding protein